MKRILIVIMLSLVMPARALPETALENKYGIGLQLGFFGMKRIDQLASPLTYEGSTSIVSLSYGYRGKKSSHYLSLSFAQPSLRTGRSFSFGDHSVSASRIQVQFSYLRLLKALWQGRCHVLLGGSWLNQLFIGKYHYYGILQESKGEIMSELDLSLMAELEMGKKSLARVQASLPLLAFIIRPGYSGALPIKKELTTFLRFTSFWTRLSCEWPGGRHFRFKLGYEFLYFRYPDPRLVRSGNDTLFGELAYTW